MTLRKYLAIITMACILLGGCGSAKAEQTAPAQADTAEQTAPAQTDTAEQAAPAQTDTAEQAAPAQTDTAEQAAPAQANTAEQAAPAQANTAETAPNQTTVVVWLDKGDVIVIEEYGDHYTVTNSDGSSEYPKSLPHIEESKCEYSELPGEWQEALTK